MDAEMFENIKCKLLSFAQEKGVRIIFAGESGSRGWGFASPDSDFDARFIYTWPETSYLSGFDFPDTMRMMGDGKMLDFEGWSIGKVTRALWSGNYVPLEWVQSPIVYIDENFSQSILERLGTPELFQPHKAVAHYYGLTRRSLGELYLTVDSSRIRTKKVMYALRACLAATHIIRTGKLPPMNWDELVQQDPTLEESLRVELGVLRSLKESVDESHEQLLPPPIAAYLKETMLEISSYKGASREVVPKDAYAWFCCDAIKGVL